MGLGLPAGGEATPHIKYDARAGRFTRVDSKEQVYDITQGFAAIFDLEQIEVGFVKMASNMAPEYRMVRVGQNLPQRPGDVDQKGKPMWKQGFKLQVKLSRQLGGDAREFMSAAACVISAMDELYDAYKAAPEAAQGMLPVVVMTGTQMIKKQADGQPNTNYKPLLSISGWQPRPADLAVSTGAAPAPAPQVPPPQAAPRPAPVPAAAAPPPAPPLPAPVPAASAPVAAPPAANVEF